MSLGCWLSPSNQFNNMFGYVPSIPEENNIKCWELYLITLLLTIDLRHELSYC